MANIYGVWTETPGKGKYQGQGEGTGKDWDDVMQVTVLCWLA